MDSRAHSAALECDGNTTVVLPQGLLSFRDGSELANHVEAGTALLVSQFIPDAPWSAPAAVTRNAIISALCKVVCVIEPKKTGGSIRTAKCALDYGRRVLIHGTQEEQATLNQLERMGALPLLEPDDTFSPDTLMRHWNTPTRNMENQARFS